MDLVTKTGERVVGYSAKLVALPINAAAELNGKILAASYPTLVKARHDLDYNNPTGFAKAKDKLITYAAAGEAVLTLPAYELDEKIGQPLKKYGNQMIAKASGNGVVVPA